MATATQLETPPAEQTATATDYPEHLRPELSDEQLDQLMGEAWDKYKRAEAEAKSAMWYYQRLGRLSCDRYLWPMRHQHAASRFVEQMKCALTSYPFDD